MSMITEQEKKFIEMLLKIGYAIIESQGGYADIDDESFSRNDLYELAIKLGFDDFSPYM